MKKLTVAICSYNRAVRLPQLIQALRAQFIQQAGYQFACTVRPGWFNNEKIHDL